MPGRRGAGVSTLSEPARSRALNCLLLVLEGVSGTREPPIRFVVLMHHAGDFLHIGAWLSGNTPEQFTIQAEIASQHVRIRG